MLFFGGRILLIIILCLVPAVSWGDSYAGAGGVVPASLRDRWNEADQAYQMGDYDRAAKITSEILQLRPDYADALSLEWKIAEKKRGPGQSAGEFSGEEGPLKNQAEMIAARHAREKEKDLLADYEKKQWQEQEKREIQQRHLDLGKKLLKKGEIKNALAEFQQVIEIDSETPLGGMAHSYRDLAQRKLEEIAEIKEEQKKEPWLWRRTDEKRVKMNELIEAAWVAAKEKEHAQAKKLLKEALLIDPLNKVAKKRLEAVEAQEYELEIRKLDDEQILIEQERALEEARMMIEVARAHELPPDPRWKEVTPSQPVLVDPSSPIQMKLKELVSADFKEVDLRDVIEFLSKSTGANIILAKRLQEKQLKVTAHFKQIPLEDVLSFLARSHRLTYRIEPEAVWITSTEDVQDEPMQTRIYFLNQGLGLFPKFTSASGGSTELGQAASVSEVTTFEDILMEAVPFSGDSKLVVDERSGALIVTHTPANLALLEKLISSLDRFPTQVLIETRFVEVNMTDLEELGAEIALTGDFALRKSNSIIRGNGGKNQGITQIDKGGGINFADFSRADEGFNLTYQGILLYPEFQVVLHAIEEKETAKTLSAPRITTLNNQTATIEVVDQFIYPTRYEVELIQFDINGDGDFNDAGETEFANVPKDFVTRDVGILLQVTPSVGGDGKSMTLTLLPEVSSSSGNFTFTGGVSIPKFTSRQLQTNVFVNEGETIMMGGLIKEKSTVIKTKVPILGNIPLLGKFFERNTDSTDRRNLLIFVTPKILTRQEPLAESS